MAIVSSAPKFVSIELDGGALGAAAVKAQTPIS